MKRLSDTRYGRNGSGKLKYRDISIGLNNVINKLRVYDSGVYRLVDYIKLNRIYISYKLRGKKNSKIRYEEIHHWKKRFSSYARDRRKYKEQRKRIFRDIRGGEADRGGEEVRDM